MNPSRAVPLFVLHILGNRAGVPAGLLAEFATAGAGAGTELLSLDPAQAAALSAHIPCFYLAGTVPPSAKVLMAGHWRELAPASVFRADAKLGRDFVPAGAQWVRGDWCLAPPPAPVGNQAMSRALALQLVQLVSADADNHQIEALLRRDPTMSYQLLRLVNSVGIGSGRRITSFSQALLILGRQQLRRWFNLMLFASRQGDMRSPMLLARVAVRARALQLLARARGSDKLTQEQAFMTGMFSLLGVLFGTRLADLLAPLALGVAVHDALLGRAGELGALLNLVESAEGGDFAALAAHIDALQIPTADFNATMVDANCWMLDAVRESRSSRHA